MSSTLRNWLFSLLLTAALAACAAEPEKLNSERIEERFGSYGIDVLQQSASVRRSNLYSLDDGRKTCRTYAVVVFNDVNAAALEDAHTTVLAGGSIGATFNAAGWRIVKSTTHIGTYRASAGDAELAQLMRLTTPTELALHVYDFELQRDDQRIRYATILEVHHPDYLTTQQLNRLYAVDSPAPLGAEALARFVALMQSD